jgi:hypothetical protein
MSESGKQVSARSAGGLAKQQSKGSDDYLPTKFHCKEGTQCLTVRARWEAWLEREVLREKGLLEADAADKQPPTTHGHHVYTLEALTSAGIGFLIVGILYVLCLIPRQNPALRVLMHTRGSVLSVGS